MCEHCGCGDTDAEQTFQQKVEDMLEIIKPMLHGHGGDIELVSVEEDNTVKVRLQGACSGCPGAATTLKQGVERLMKEKIPELKEVIAVS